MEPVKEMASLGEVQQTSNPKSILTHSFFQVANKGKNVWYASVSTYGHANWTSDQSSLIQNLKSTWFSNKPHLKKGIKPVAWLDK